MAVPPTQYALVFLRQSGTVRDGERCRGGWRSRSRGDCFRGCFGLRCLQEVSDYRSERVDEATREPSLPQPEDVRLLQPTADVDVQIEPLEHGEERGIRPELRTEAAPLQHADRREHDASYPFR